MYKKWIELGLSKGLKDLEIFAVRNRSLKLGVYQNELDQHVQSDVEVVNIRGIYNHKLSTIKFENLSTSNVDQMLDQLIENAKALTIEEPAIIFEGSPSYPEVKDEIYDFSKINVLNKIELLKDLEKTILTNKYVSQVQTSVYQENDTTTTLINSKGLYLTRRNTYAYAYAIGVFKKDDDIKTAYDIKLVKSFEQFEAKKMAEETIHKGVSKLGGSSIPSKSYPIVFSNEKFSDLLQVFSTIFSGESAYRNLTALKDKVGLKIANESFNLIDDPLHKDAYFQTPFDDEGVACKKRHVVEKGVFTGFNHNLKTAKIYNVEPTGNGFGGGISPTNLYLEPKAQSFEDIIKDIQDGVYITELVGLHAGVKTVSGDFSLQASGFKIKAGEIDHPVKMIVISGNFFEMINEIVEIGSDLKFGLSGIGSPSVYIKRLMVGGDV